MGSIGDYLTLAKNFQDIAWQAWYFHIFVNIAALGWAANSRREGGTGIPAGYVLMTVAALLLFDLITIGAAEHYTVRADLALEYVRLKELGTSPEVLAELRETLLAPTKYGVDLFIERSNSVRFFFAVDMLVALMVFFSLSKVGRKR